MGTWVLHTLSGATLLLAAACATSNAPEAASAVGSARRMADGLQWMTRNLNIAIEDSYCFADDDRNCAKYGRLYTWKAALAACRSLGDPWRLPTEGEWKELALRHGGLFNGPADQTPGSLLIGSNAGFDALRGGNRSPAGAYERVEAHGFYWTASETGPGTAWFYNFGRISPHPNRHEDGDKRMAVSVRCVKP